MKYYDYDGANKWNKIIKEGRAEKRIFNFWGSKTK